MSQFRYQNNNKSSADSSNSEEVEDQVCTLKDVAGHILMTLILVIIIMLFVKNYCLTTAGSFDSYTYVEAFGIPMVLITLTGAELVYQKYIKLLES